MGEYYPVFLDLRGRRCLVVGGGAVAERKVMQLLEADASVRVVSPEATSRLRQLASEGRVTLAERPARADDLRDAALAILATDDRALNSSLGAEARAQGVLVNVVDSPEECDFIAPSVVRRGGLTIAISTGGRSPALAKRMRLWLEEALSTEMEELPDLLAEVRRELRERGQRADPESWQRAIDTELLELLRRGERDEARRRLTASLAASAEGEVSSGGAR